MEDRLLKIKSMSAKFNREKLRAIQQEYTLLNDSLQSVYFLESAEYLGGDYDISSLHFRLGKLQSLAMDLATPKDYQEFCNKLENGEYL